MSAISRERASRRLASWVRKRRAVITSSPSAVILDPAARSRRSRTSGGSARERAAWKRSWTAVATLFTFCPPGPPAWMKRSSSSSSGMVMSGVISSMWFRSSPG